MSFLPIILFAGLGLAIAGQSKGTRRVSNRYVLPNFAELRGAAMNEPPEGFLNPDTSNGALILTNLSSASEHKRLVEMAEAYATQYPAYLFIIGQMQSFRRLLAKAGMPEEVLEDLSELPEGVLVIRGGGGTQGDKPPLYVFPGSGDAVINEVESTLQEIVSDGNLPFLMARSEPYGAATSLRRVLGGFI